MVGYSIGWPPMAESNHDDLRDTSMDLPIFLSHSCTYTEFYYPTDSDRYPYITTGRDIMPDYVRMRHLPVRALEHYD